MSKPAPPEDIQFILEKFKDLRPHIGFRGETVLLTGATGFFGKWLTQALIAMNDQWKLDNQLYLVTRDQNRTLENLPWLRARNDVHFLEGDIRTVHSEVKFTSIVHGAAAASQALNEGDPEEMFETIVDGTKNVLRIAKDSACKRLQFISSGGVYGVQPPSIEHLPETFSGAPDVLNPAAAYGEAKRAAELLAVIASRDAGFTLSIARCFAFTGPYLPLDSHFAAGNFMNAVLRNERIKIGGDGTPYRSYLYAADLVAWLLIILLGDSKRIVFNVGSPESLSILEIARSIHSAGCKIFPQRSALENPITIARPPDPNGNPSRYVPSVALADAEYQLRSWHNLAAATEKTLRWHVNG